MTKQEALRELAVAIHDHVEALKTTTPTRLTSQEIQAIITAIGDVPHADNIAIIETTLRDRGIDEDQIAEVLAMVRQKRIQEIEKHGES